MDKQMPLMKCGHIANAFVDGQPVCCFCYGITPEAIQIDEKTQNLDNRKAKCGYCGKVVDSNKELPFFEHKPNADFDSYYCGCEGWN